MSGAFSHERMCCSFCGKSQHEVRSLIEGGCSRRGSADPACVFICEACVALCAQIIAGTAGEAAVQEH